MKNKCEECIFFYGKDFKTNVIFLRNSDIKKLNFETDRHDQLYSIIGVIKLCQHKDCFENMFDLSNKKIILKMIRIKGQRQLNLNGECSRFVMKKRYILWNRIKNFFKWEWR
jgi:hypothetical protein